MANAKTKALTITNMPTQLVQAYKARCVLQGRTMSDCLIELIKEEVNKRTPTYRRDDDNDRRDY